MINKIKPSITLLTIAISFTLSANEIPEEQHTHTNCPIEHVQKKAKSFLSSKKSKKSLKKLKAQLEEKKGELVAQITDSKLSDSQKNSLIEILDKTETKVCNQAQ